jgi:hypothetical protein
MKRIHTTAALLIFGLATPLLAQAIAPTIAIAQSNNVRANNPDGVFKGGDFTVAVYYRNGTYQYDGRGLGDASNSIHLAGATVVRDGQRKVYTWNNSGTRYQVIWRAQDPDFIRVRVTTPRGKEVLNRLFSRCEQGC